MRIEEFSTMELNESSIRRMFKEAEESKRQGQIHLEKAKKNLKVCRINVKILQRTYRVVVFFTILNVILIFTRLSL